MAEARADWSKQQRRLDPAKLVFLDETWATTNMVRRFGRSPRGERVTGAVPYGHWKTSTFVAALRQDGLTAPLVLDGAMNGRAFLAYVQQFLAPTLNRGDVVIMVSLRRAPPSPILEPALILCARLRTHIRTGAGLRDGDHHRR